MILLKGCKAEASAVFSVSPRQVGSVCVGMEPWLLFMLTEQVRCTNRGGISGCGPSASSRESPSRILKESSSWFTVLESDGDSPSPAPCPPASALPFPQSWYSTSRSVSLSVTMQQPDTFSVHTHGYACFNILQVYKKIHFTDPIKVTVKCVLISAIAPCMQGNILFISNIIANDASLI